jgi:hypothetical protein
MKIHIHVWSCLVVAAVASACSASGKQSESPASAIPAAQPAPSITDSRPASPAATSGVAANVGSSGAGPKSAADGVNPVTTAAVATAALAGATGAAGAAPAAAAPAASSTPAASAAPATPAVDASPEAARKRAQIEWALRQDEIKNHPRGQWAVQAKASSSYNDAQGAAAHSAVQATGAPDVETYGNNNGAWSPKTPNAGIEWRELAFPKAVHATAVRVRESYSPGSIIKVEVFDEQGAAHPVWSGIDPTKDLDYLTVQFPRTAFKTARVKVTLATNTVPGYKQIDAVQLIGTEQ